MGKILVAANDQSLLDTLTRRLHEEAYEVVVVSRETEVREAVQTGRPALIVLDLQISDMNGPSLCRKIRSASDVAHMPIIVGLTAVQDTSATAELLNAGADDCMIKPIDPEELVARIRARLRHTGLPPQGILRAGPIEMDIDRRALRVEGRAVELTIKEFHLLRELLQARGRVLPRETLLQNVWQHARARHIDTRTVDVHVGRLRHKLGNCGRHIITVRNVGYRLDIFPDWTGPDAETRN